MFVVPYSLNFFDLLVRLGYVTTIPIANNYKTTVTDTEHTHFIKNIPNYFNICIQFSKLLIQSNKTLASNRKS